MLSDRRRQRLPRLPPQLIGSEPALGRRYLKALSVAFAQTHIANQSKYQLYLEAAYAKAISQAPLELSLVQSSTTTQLTQTLNGSGKPLQTLTKTRYTRGLRCDKYIESLGIVS